MKACEQEPRGATPVFADPVGRRPLSSPQPHHLGGCGGGHLRHLCDVLRSSQLRPLFDPGEGHPGQAAAVCQRRQSFGLLDGQPPLGHGAVTTLCVCVLVVCRCSPPWLILSSSSSRSIIPSVLQWWWKFSFSLIRNAIRQRPTCNR